MYLYYVPTLAAKVKPPHNPIQIQLNSILHKI